MADKKSVDLSDYEWIHGRNKETGDYYAYIQELPGCMGIGATLEEALQKLEEIGNAWVEAELEDGRSIPSPFDPGQYNGKFALRMSAGLHQQAAKMAARENSSLNKYISEAIAARVGADDLLDRMSRRLAFGQVNNYFNFQPWSGGGVPTSMGHWVKLPTGESTSESMVIGGS